MNTQRRPAFSLFELLVILGLLGLGAGLFFPAILKVRVAAARAQSQNNLKQLALGCHNYADVNGHFPCGRDANGFSAGAYLLPYIEQDNLFKTIDFTKPIDNEKNLTPRKAVIQVFLNPQDKGPAPKAEYGANNYLFSAGSKPALKDNDGAFYQDSKVKFTDIADGTSNTGMIGETLKGDAGTKAMNVRRQYVKLDKDALGSLNDESGVQDFKDDKHIAGDRCASWMDGSFLQGTFTSTRQPNDARPDVSCGGIGGLSGLRSMEAIVQMALCDGSVRTISTKISKETWKALATRAGGEVLGSDF